MPQLYVGLGTVSLLHVLVRSETSTVNASICGRAGLALGIRRDRSLLVSPFAILTLTPGSSMVSGVLAYGYAGIPRDPGNAWTIGLAVQRSRIQIQ